MDAVTRSLLKEFVDSQSLSASDEPTQFEHFCNYLVALDTIGGDFDIESIATASGEFGIDGIAIVLNDTLIEDDEQLTDIIENSRALTCSFLFVQSKSSGSFNSAEILKFTTSVSDFFKSDASLNGRNRRIKDCHNFFKRIYDAAGKFTRGLPSLHMFYACTGVWRDDPLLGPLLERTVNEFHDTSMFSDVKFTPVDAGRLQRLYFKSKNAIKSEVELPVSVPMPDIANVKEAYIGVINAREYMKLILDENGEIIKRVFFDNLRDYQGDTDVNQSIGATLTSPSASQFAIRNNGVTIVARALQRVANKFIIEDYQIVNGCQSSHVLAAHSKDLSPDVYCPVKIVNTDHEDTIREIIISSNRQNEISSDSFCILDDIHKKLEIYFEQQPSEIKLYYERRSGQYDMTTVERTRVISKDTLLKSYATMFLGEINRVGRYYKDLLPLIRKTIFAPNDNLAPYHTSALAYWRLEFLFRTKRLDRSWKAFRFPLLLIACYIVEDEEGLKREDALSDRYCSRLNSYLQDSDTAAGLFFEANAIATKIVEDMSEEYSKRVAKMRDFRDRVDSYFAFK